VTLLVILFDVIFTIVYWVDINDVVT